MVDLILGYAFIHRIEITSVGFLVEAPLERFVVGGQSRSPRLRARHKFGGNTGGIAAASFMQQCVLEFTA
jgi:hypothetical protein